jgi:hypothetical protein
MQKLYEKVFKDSPSKKSNFDFFSSKKDERHLERSVELINIMRPTEKEEVI